MLTDSNQYVHNNKIQKMYTKHIIIDFWNGIMNCDFNIHENSKIIYFGFHEWINK